MNTEKTIEELKKNVFQNYIFYIPSFLLPQSSNLPNEAIGLLDKVIYSDNIILNNLPSSPDYSKYKLDEQLITKSILLKSNTLNKNIHFLIDIKRNLPNHEFKFFINTYYDFVKSNCIWGNTQLNMIKTTGSNISETMTNIFKVQLQSFNTHLSQIENNFKIKQKVKDNTPNLSALIMDLYQIALKNEKDIILGKDKECNEDKIGLSTYINHAESKEIVKIISNKYSGKKGKELRCVIEYLIRRGLITLEQGKQNLIYQSLKILFNDEICKYQSIFGYEVDKREDKTYIAVRAKFITQLEQINIKL